MAESVEVGFYEWLDRPASATAQRREHLKARITKIFADSDETYGYRRVHAELARTGEQVSDELVRKLMRELELVPCQPKPWRPATTEQGDFRGIPDLVRRNFTAAAPGTKFVGDITYIPTWEGFLYLATVIDCHTKAVVGWAMADHYKTSLIEAAIDMAATNVRVALDTPPGVITTSSGAESRQRDPGDLVLFASAVWGRELGSGPARRPLRGKPTPRHRPFPGLPARCVASY